MSGFTVTVKGANEIAIRFEGAAGKLANARAIVGTNLKYARMVHDGTRPHVITARKAKALFWPGARHPVRSVRHPGTKARPFLTDALTAQRGAIVALLTTRVAQILDGGGGDFRQALLAAGYLVQRDAQGRAPVRTGTLRRSLHTEVT